MNPEYMGIPFELPTYAHEVTLADQMKRTGFKFSYTYDFGDNWDHDIFFEKRLPFDENFKYPICLEGENACPPDDIGGILYFYDRLDAAKNPDKYPDWDADWLEHLAGWLRDFDLHAFDIDVINKALRWNRSLGEYDDELVERTLEWINDTIHIEDIFEKTGIDDTPEHRQKIFEKLFNKNDLVVEGENISSTAQMLEKLVIRIYPTPWELSEGILIPGQALMPFNLFLEEGSLIRLLYKLEPMRIHREKIAYSRAQPFFNLLNDEQIQLFFNPPGSSSDREVEFEVWDLRPFYKTTNFKEGDAVFLKPFDLDDSSFEIRYRSRQKNEKKAAQIRQADTKFLSSLKTVIESAVPLRSITQQVIYALQNLYPAMWPVPPNPLHELIESSGELRPIEPGRGKKILQVI